MYPVNAKDVLEVENICDVIYNECKINRPDILVNQELSN
jgi:hypothetical protein